MILYDSYAYISVEATHAWDLDKFEWCWWKQPYVYNHSRQNYSPRGSWGMPRLPHPSHTAVVKQLIGSRCALKVSMENSNCCACCQSSAPEHPRFHSTWNQLQSLKISVVRGSVCQNPLHDVSLPVSNLASIYLPPTHPFTQVPAALMQVL